MSSTVQRFYQDQEYFETQKEQEPLNKDVENILELFRLLSPENKVKVKQLLKSEKIF